MRTYVLSGISQKVPLPPSPFIYYRGLTLFETTGGAVLVKVWDSATGPDGNLLEIQSLPGYASVNSSSEPKIARVGLWIQVTGVGAIQGAVYFD